MMDWTDRHCRYLHRRFSRGTLLYTEMLTASAILHGDAARLLAYHAQEHPIALQLGGADPTDLGAATRLASDFGFDEINLNVGCPSDRVQSGCFGAALMLRPALVGECAQAMIESSPNAEITVKCRIGVDHQQPRDTLPRFLETMRDHGVRTVAIHARKAWLEGLSPKQNRNVPPLEHALVVDMKKAFPDLNIVINGGIATLDQAIGFLEAGLDGVMIGRAAYQTPQMVLGEADRRVFGLDHQISAQQAVREMLPYIEHHLNTGGRLNQITRHMLGLFAGLPGARNWRRILSEQAHLPGAGPDVVKHALSMLSAAKGLQLATES